MVFRGNRFWMTFMASLLVWVTLVAAGVVHAANTLPIAGSWNISSSGKASASGELLFRVTTEADSDPVEVTVFVLSGANETGVASSIRRAFSTQLDSSRFDVAAGEGALARHRRPGTPDVRIPPAVPGPEGRAGDARQAAGPAAAQGAPAG